VPEALFVVGTEHLARLLAPSNRHSAQRGFALLEVADEHRVQQCDDLFNGLSRHRE
jgi:hypothetical protein